VANPRCFSRATKKRVHDSDKLMAAIAVKHILRHLDLAGYVIMKGRQP
jgi:hypothetical protein